MKARFTLATIACLVVWSGAAFATTTFIQNFNALTTPVGGTFSDWIVRDVQLDPQLTATYAAGSPDRRPWNPDAQWKVTEGQSGWGLALSDASSLWGNPVFYNRAGNMNPNEGTVEMWWKPDADYDTGNSYLFETMDTAYRGANNASATGACFLRYQPGPETLVFFFADANANPSTPQFACSAPNGLPIVPGTWYHVAFTYSPTGVQVFFNGIAGEKADIPWQTSGMLEFFEIGGYGAGGNGFSGSIDSVRLSDTVLYSGSSYTVPAAEFVPVLTGQVVLSDFVPSPSETAVTIQLRSNGSVVRTQTLLLDENGRFEMAGVVSGTYDIAIKACSWLRKTIPGVQVGGQTDIGIITLANGDVDGDNEITSTDLSILGLGLGQTGDE